MGLGMTGAAYATSYEAAYVNPALLGGLERNAVYLGAAAVAFQVTAGGERALLDPSRGITIGFQLPLPFGGPLENRFVIGGSLFTPDDTLLEGRVLYAEAPQFPLLDQTQTGGVHISLGVNLDDLVPGLRIGGGVSVMARVIGELAVQLDETNQFSSTVETQFLAGYAPVVGVAYENGPLELGLVYRHELLARISLNVATSNLPVELPVLRVGGVVTYDPHQIVLEAAYRPIPSLRVIAQGRYRFWSAYPGAQQRTTDGSLLAPAPEFSDTFSPRVAVEGIIEDPVNQVALSIRGGYALELSPAPAARSAFRRGEDGQAVGEAIPFRTFDNDRHVLTAGLGVSHEFDDKRLSLDLYAQAHLLSSREHQVGLSDGDEEVTTAGAVWAGGWTIGLEFDVSSFY